MSLRLDGLAVDIAGRPIVTGIDLTVGDHEFAGLVGPNGSGKSTILKAIYRVHSPSAGRVLLDGKDLLSLRPKDAARRIAVVTQESTSEFDFTVREMVMIGRTPHKGSFDRDTDADHGLIDQAIERVGCQELAYRRFNTLSGGEKQLILIARALAQEADHLILDEPTNHLDIHHQVEILELVAGLGVTVLAALHDLSLAALFCRTIYVLRAGQLLTGGPPGAVLTPETIRQAYGADVLVIEHPDTGTPHLIPRRVQPATRSQPGQDAPAQPRAQPDTPLSSERIPVRHNEGSPHPAGRRAGRSLAVSAALLAVFGGLAACGSSTPTATATATASAKASSKYPVTVSSCGVPVIYDRAPQRAVANDINTTEDMLALGLESHMAGTFGAVGDGPVDQPAIPPQYQAGFNKVRDVSPQNYFTLEQLVGVRPDFLFAG